jgi:hypothetical protein
MFPPEPWSAAPYYRAAISWWYGLYTALFGPVFSQPCESLPSSFLNLSARFSFFPLFSSLLILAFMFVFSLRGLFLDFVLSSFLALPYLLSFVRHKLDVDIWEKTL